MQARSRQRLDHPEHHQRHQRADKKKRRQDKRRTSILNPAQIDESQDRKNKKAQQQRMWLQPRHRARQRRHSRRDPHRSRQNVVDHQRRGRQKTRAVAQVLARDRVAAATVWVRRNGLAVAEKYDHQQNQNRGNNRQQVLDAQQTQRNQDVQGLLRPIRRTRQCVQPKDRDPRRNPNLLPTLVAGSQRLA